jgi:ABC-type phosphate transport system permease subunit
MVAGSLATTPGFAHGAPYFFLAPIRTMASAIVETGGEAMSIDVIQGALFGLATLLLMFSLALSLVARAAFTWFARRSCPNPAG